MKIEHTQVFGFRMAIQYAMRNPMDSWDDSDSEFYMPMPPPVGTDSSYIHAPENPNIGPNDLKLARRLIIRGSEHSKFMRQIIVWVNITIPRYVWQELDTYKVATVRNSCSTMNKLGSTDLEQSDFQHPIPHTHLENINALAKVLREAKQEHEGVREARVQLKNDLPEGYLQRASYTFSYQTALAMLLQRANHRLPEWRIDCEGSICHWLVSLPYMKEFYEAATWKKNEIRNVIAEMMQLELNLKDKDPGTAQAISILRSRLKRAA